MSRAPDWILNVFLIFNIVLFLLFYISVLGASTAMSSECFVVACVRQIASLPVSVLWNEFRISLFVRKLFSSSEGQDIRVESAMLLDCAVEWLVFVFN